MVGTFNAGVEILDAVRERPDPPVHYAAAGVVSGFTAGSLANFFLDRPVTFRGKIPIILGGAALIGVGGLAMGVARRYQEDMDDAAIAAAAGRPLPPDERTISERLEDYLSSFTGKRK